MADRDPPPAQATVAVTALIAVSSAAEKPRSRRPRTSPNATHPEVVGKVVYLRQNYHFGPGKISMYLKRAGPARLRPAS